MFAAPPSIATARLVLRRPTLDDADAIFHGFSSDPEATRFMSWRTHAAIDETRAFLRSALESWTAEGVGTYLVALDGAVIGSTGLHPERAGVAETGYILRRDAWGKGYATEACARLVALGHALGISRVQASCFVEHAASAHVLQKSGLAFEGVVRKYMVLPNLAPLPQDMRLFASVK